MEKKQVIEVLILVLMEDTLREHQAQRKSKQDVVLILVLMEDTLREPSRIAGQQPNMSLNPCFNGRYSQSHTTCR